MGGCVYVKAKKADNRNTCCVVCASDRFDLPDDAHWHVICDKCGQVKDIPVDREILDRIEHDSGEQITSYLLTAHCTCKKCREAEIN